MQAWQQLTWADFTVVENPGPGQMLARNGSPVVASVTINIRFSHSQSTFVQQGSNWIYSRVSVWLELVQARYVPSRLPASQRAYYLRHEQGHMDLMGLMARELEVKLLTLRATSTAELHDAASSPFHSVIADAQLLAINSPRGDCQYDLDTNHGMNPGRQGLWNRHIRNQISRMSNPTFEFQTLT